MRHHHAGALVLAAALACSGSSGAPGTGSTGGTGPTGAIMPDARRTTWNPGIPGGIPAVTHVFATLDAAYGDGSADATAAINAAIQAAGDAASAGSRQVVYLPAGAYRVTAPVLLDRSHVVLRGAGAGATRILLSTTGEMPALRVGYRAAYGAVIAVVGTAPRGATTLTVADASTIRAGDVLQLDQEDGPAAATGEGHYWNGDLWMGDGHYEKRQPGTDLSGPGTGGVAWGGSGAWLDVVNWNALHGGPWRSVLQQVEVTGKSGDTLTLHDPLHVAFEAARHPQVFKTVSIVDADALGTRYAGVEDLAVTGGTNDNIDVVNCAYCWLARIESDGELVPGDPLHPGMTGRSIQLLHAYRSVVRDSYVHHARSIVNGGGAYGIAVENGSSENLVEDDICVWLNKPIVMNVSGGGNVVAYNYVDNAMIAGTGWQESAIDGCHQASSHADLFEGNWAPNVGSDTTHGSAALHVFFRNYATGRNGMPYDRGADGGVGLPWKNLRAAGADALSREHTFVGNVLTVPDAGWGTFYEGNPASHPYLGAFVYQLGAGGIGGTGGEWDTGQAAAAVFRHANWDSVTAGVVWADGYARTLPSSLYLDARPAFFGADPWPWVDPLGATAADRVHVLPAQQRYAAGHPNTP